MALHRSRLLLISLLVLLSACSGTQDADTSDGTPAAEEADVADGDLDLDIEVPDVGAFDAEVTEEFCAEISTVLEVVGVGGETPEELRDSFAAIDRALAAALDVAPEGTTDSLGGTRAFFAELDEASAAVEYDESQLDDALFADLEAEYGEDVETMEAYFAACELDF